MSKKKYAAIIALITLLIGFVQITSFPSQTSTKYADVKIGELHSVEGVKNHWIKSPGYVVEFESFRKISIPILDLSTGWISSGLKGLEMNSNAGQYALKNESGIWDIKTPVKYLLKQKTIFNTIKISYLEPVRQSAIRKTNHRKLSQLKKNNQEYFIDTISKEELPEKLFLRANNEKNEFKEQIFLNFGKKESLNISVNLIEQKNEKPYVLIKNITKSKIKTLRKKEKPYIIYLKE